MTLREKQSKFAKMFAKLILWAFDNGYEVTLGEVQRTEAQAKANAAAGIGIKNSLHLSKLAGDLFLFKDGKYLATREDYRPLGEFWESMGGSWGGRFKTLNDPFHFSVEHNGVR